MKRKIVNKCPVEEKVSEKLEKLGFTETFKENYIYNKGKIIVKKRSQQKTCYWCVVVNGIEICKFGAKVTDLMLRSISLITSPRYDNLINELDGFVDEQHKLIC